MGLVKLLVVVVLLLIAVSAAILFCSYEATSNDVKKLISKLHQTKSKDDPIKVR